MDSIRFAPSAILRFPNDPLVWQQALFNLAVQKKRSTDPVESYWRQFASACLTAIAHAANPDTPSASEGDAVMTIAPQDLSPFLHSVPIMQGAEYVNLERLTLLWHNFLEWCGHLIAEAGGITPFLAKYAPQWNEIGRIFFHLGENKLDADKPFAFLATYTTGLTEKGQLRHTPLAKALQMYADSRPDLLRLLKPVSQAAASLPWVRNLWESNAIYKALAWTPGQAHRFLKSALALEQSGIGVRLPDWWKKRPRVQVKATIESKDGTKLGLQSLMACDLQLAMGDMPLDEEEIARILDSGQEGLVLIKNQWIEVDSAKLTQALKHWQQVQKLAAAGQLSFIEGMRLLAGFDDDLAENEDAAAIREWSAVQADKQLKIMLDHARGQAMPEAIAGLYAQLRPYQQEGVRWLRFMGQIGLGTCLADDMGLGKTIQILSLLLLERAQKPALLVVPASLIANWQQESARFAPDLRLFVLHPAKLDKEAMTEAALKEQLANYDLVITTYGMCSRLKWLADVQWSRVILDEAQNIKNRNTKQSIAVRKLQAPSKIALTGTPIENSLMDLWTIFDFINPGLMTGADQFAKLAKQLQKSGQGLAPIRNLAAPYILRRMKTDKEIVSSLPEKTEVRLCCNLTPKQVRLYKKIVDEMAQQIKKLAVSNDINPKARNMLVLQNLMRLKQVCNHPGQAGQADEADFHPASSGKFLRVGELCKEIAAKQEKVLIFTQFREIIKPLSSYLAQVFGEPGLVLHGATPMKSRGGLVEQFQRDDGPPFFILSLKAGGSGLTLTQASHVIHFDRWWNPAVENQATDRAFRIGQKKNVLVHKCITLGTLEEKIDELIESKKELAADVLDDLDANVIGMTDDQLLDFVKLDAATLVAAD